MIAHYNRLNFFRSAWSLSLAWFIRYSEVAAGYLFIANPAKREIKYYPCTYYMYNNVINLWWPPSSVCLKPSSFSPSLTRLPSPLLRRDGTLASSLVRRLFSNPSQLPVPHVREETHPTPPPAQCIEMVVSGVPIKLVISKLDLIINQRIPETGQNGQKRGSGTGQKRSETGQWQKSGSWSGWNRSGSGSGQKRSARWSAGSAGWM